MNLACGKAVVDTPAIGAIVSASLAAAIIPRRVVLACAHQGQHGERCHVEARGHQHGSAAAGVPALLLYKLRP